MIALPTNLSVIPRPSHLWRGEGSLALRNVSALSFPPAFSFEAEQLSELLLEAGVAIGGAEPISIAFYHDQDDPESLGPEGYSLDIDDQGIQIRAATAAGAFYAVQTIRQLLPVSAQGEAPSLPHCRVVDRPAFVWRGMMFDVSRHFFTVDEIKGILDLLAFHKLNIFHWHLVDDGGWRLEIKSYPELTRRGAWRTKKEFVWDYLDIEFPGPGTDKPLYGGFYTQEEIADIVRYAEARHITVVPEIEMPGHSLAALWSYPELACTEEAAAIFREKVGMPFPNVFCAGKEETFIFLEKILDEVMAMFPSKYIHIGGDEVFKVLFENCEHCQKRMKDEGLENVDELQSYFIRRIERHIHANGRILVGWDEILQGGLAPNAVVMSWRGTQGGIDAARAGHDVVMTPFSHCYFDFGYDKTPTEHVLDFRPIAPEMTLAEGAHVLGGQANLWTEYVPDLATMQRMTFPRLASMSEVLWLGKPDLSDFATRLDVYRDHLRSLGVQQNDDQDVPVPWIPNPRTDVS